MKKLGMNSLAMTTVSSIATTYMRMGDFTQALAIYRESLQQQRSAGMRREQLVTEYNIGRILERQEDWTEAGRQYESSLQLSRDLQYPRGEAFALRGLAAVAQGRGDAPRAMQLLDTASTLQKQIPDARLAAALALARGISLHATKPLARPHGLSSCQRWTSCAMPARWANWLRSMTSLPRSMWIWVTGAAPFNGRRRPRPPTKGCCATRSMNSSRH